ncbi:MAG: hypothetical protein HKN23_02915, partial [Verrucomicrobiales bacterium]|nr:hypothetical protein [Verrucomicrobiales bacterium]
MPDFQELDAMLARLVDETISPDELADLERRLDGDPDAQRRYLHYLDLHSDLAEGKGATRTEKSAPMIQRRGWLISGLAAAAAVCIGAFIFLNSNGPAPVIRVVDSDGPVRWLDDGGKVDSAIVPGREFPNGTLEALTPDS